MTNLSHELSVIEYRCTLDLTSLHLFEGSSGGARLCEAHVHVVLPCQLYSCFQNHFICIDAILQSAGCSMHAEYRLHAVAVDCCTYCTWQAFVQTLSCHSFHESTLLSVRLAQAYCPRNDTCFQRQHKMAVPKNHFLHDSGQSCLQSNTAPHSHCYVTVAIVKSWLDICCCFVDTMLLPPLSGCYHHVFHNVSY